MPIVVEYQPSFALAGQLAYEGALGQYEQEQAKFGLQQAELAERMRQNDMRFALESQGQYLRDQESQRNFLANQSDQAGQLQYRYDALAAEMSSDARREQTAADNIEAQYAASMNRELIETARQAERRRFDAALQQQNSLQKYINDNRTVLSPDQVLDLQAQFEQTTGLEFGFDMSQALRAQEAVEGTAMARRVQGLRSLAETGQISDDLAAEMIADPNLRGDVFQFMNNANTTRQRATEAEKRAQYEQQRIDLDREQMALQQETNRLKEEETTGRRQQQQSDRVRTSLNETRSEMGLFYVSNRQWNRAVEENKGKALGGYMTNAGFISPPPAVESLKLPLYSPEQLEGAEIPSWSMFRVSLGSGKEAVMVQLPTGETAAYTGKQIARQPDGRPIVGPDGRPQLDSVTFDVWLDGLSQQKGIANPFARED